MIVETQKGSATDPRPAGEVGVIIAHLTNSVGAWGAGFVLAVDKVSRIPRGAYQSLVKADGGKTALGITQFVEIAPNFWVANMIAQNGIDRSAVDNGVLVDYAAFNDCLKTVAERAVLLNCNVHMPAGIGSGLAGGDKQMITDMVHTVAVSTPVALLEQQMEFIPRVTLWEYEEPVTNVDADSAGDDILADVLEDL